MLGILFAQVWHWASWTKKERPFIRIIVVSFSTVSAKTACIPAKILMVLWFVLFTSLGSSVFAMTWQYHLFVTEYGSFSQFVDDNCKSSTPSKGVWWKTDRAGFSWLPIVDHGVITACHIFNLDRAYRLNGKNIWLIVAVVPFM
jgi:hypothetical protein